MLRQQEIPQRIILEPAAFSENAGLLTASGKLSRTALIRRFLHAGCACQTVDTASRGVKLTSSDFLAV